MNTKLLFHVVVLVMPFAMIVSCSRVLDHEAFLDSSSCGNSFCDGCCEEIETSKSVSNIENELTSINSQPSRYNSGFENDTLPWDSIFMENKNYSHIFIEDIYDYSNPIIPCESTYDLEIAKRLGFRISEANIHATATYGKYVVMHGIDGRIGGQLVNLDGSSAANVVISETSFDDLRNNYKYKSIYEEYQTPIVSLEEWLTKCKTLDLMPLVSYVDDVSLKIVKDFFGDDFILYNGTREKHKGMIMRYSETFTEEQIVSLCKEYGAPLMVNVASFSNYETDEELINVINKVHESGCFFGMCGCYMSGSNTLRGWRCGADFSASSSEINHFDDGDIYNLSSKLSFDGFYTSGTIEIDSISLLTGQTVSIPVSQKAFFLHASQLEIVFDGEISISMVGAKNVDSLFSDAKQSIRWSGFAVEKAPSFLITALTDTSIKYIEYQAKEM